MVEAVTQADRVVFSDRGYSVALHRPQSYPAESGFHHQVDLVAGPFRGTIDATAWVNLPALRQFHDELVHLYQSLEGEANLGAGYENLTLKLMGDGRGHIWVDVVAIAGPSNSTRLSYEFSIDQTQLPPAIASLSRFLPS